jgi:hypothetical protein
MRAAYMKAMASTATTRNETAKLSGQTIQACELMGLSPFCALQVKTNAFGMLDNLLFLRNYAFMRPRKISCLLAIRDALKNG